MEDLHTLQEVERPVRTVQTDEGVEHVVDLGSDATNAAVDVVGGTAIVLFDGEQHDVDVPSDAEAFIRNGVLTIVTEDSA